MAVGGAGRGDTFAELRTTLAGCPSMASAGAPDTVLGTVAERAAPAR
ncbi:hypothetical protein [Streptomyces sp. NBC_00091]|nr:hypothetical protein [Streptomyces sp. NBC_00091]MCX5380459.1 hypothetical protein [Streptomyces sp. NBC_00091]